MLLIAAPAYSFLITFSLSLLVIFFSFHQSQKSSLSLPLRAMPGRIALNLPSTSSKCSDRRMTVRLIAALNLNIRQIITYIAEFVDLLNEMRRGTISPAALITFKSLSRPLPPSPLSVAPTELFPLRNEVTRSNLARLSALSTPLHIYTSRDSGSAGIEQRKKLLDGMMAVEELRVKEGAQVMLIKNLGEGACPSGSLVAGGGLVNGSVGVVLGFWRAGDVWGDTGSGNGKGACGAIRNVKIGTDGKTPLICPKVVDEMDKENTVPGKKASEDKGKGKPRETYGELFPLVQFLTSQGSETVLLMREEFRIEDSEGKTLARRMQVCVSFYRFEPLSTWLSRDSFILLFQYTDSTYPCVGDVDP